MLDYFCWVLTILLILIALCGLIPYQPRHFSSIAIYWLSSFISQSFSPQLSVACLLLAGVSLVSNASAFSIFAGLFGCVLYGYIYQKGSATKPVVDEVINDAIASLKLSDSSDPCTLISQKKHLVPTGIRPLKFSHDDVVCTKNISYGSHGKANLLDIYHPKIPNELMPVLVFVPGGAWITGSKNEQGLPLLNHMAANGWLCFSINYRLGPKFRFPSMLEDVLNVVSWVKTQAQQYGGDPNFIALAGNSAGGHLSSIAAMATPTLLQQLKLDFPPVKIDVVVSLYGRYDFLNRHQILSGNGMEPFLMEKVMPCAPIACPELWALASPESLVHKDVPPFLMIHGTADAMIPVQEARAFHAALSQVSNQSVDYLEIPGAQHAYDLVCSTWAMPTVYGIYNYLSAYHKRHLHSKQTE